MQYLELAPPPPLSSVVQCFWFLRGDLTGAAPETIVPDGRMEIILHLGEPFAELDGAGISRRQSHALVAGQILAPLRLSPGGATDVVGIRLRPAGARSLLRGPITELGGAVTPLGLVAPRLMGALIDAVAREDDPGARGRNLVAALGRSVLREPEPVVAAAVQALGLVQPPSLAALADRLGVSRRTLERRVLAQTGLTPRTLRRVLRFRRAFRLLHCRTAGDWSGVAVRAGYYDQAHLIRDFHRFAGAAPTAFFRDDPALARALTSADDPAA